MIKGVRSNVVDANGSCGDYMPWTLDRIRALIPLPDEEMVPLPEHFLHASAIHGQAHVARVLVHALRLVESTGFVEETRRLWAAVYLHDLARRNDWGCDRHGRDAGDLLQHLPKVLALFERVGIRESDHPAIEFSVTSHCTIEPAPSDPHYRLAALLKDADGLDRVRLGDLDPRYFRHKEARGMVKFARQLYRTTDQEIPSGCGYFSGLWKTIYNES